MSPFVQKTLLFFALLLFPVIASAQYPVNATPNYSISFDVHVKKDDPLLPHVQVQLKGADEVRKITSLLEEKRYKHFRGDGKITQIGTDIVWEPNGLQSTLTYDVVIPNERKPGIFDSYGRRNWVITRTADLFPRKRFDFRKSAKSYTTVHFDLPQSWTVVTAMPEIGEHTFRAFPTEDKSYEWPTGWLIYGKVQTKVIKSGDVTIRIAYPYDFIRPTLSKDPERIKRRQKYLDWFNAKITNAEEIYSKVIPVMTSFLPEYAKDFLVIMGKDPMWKGGLSGENSLYINRGVPNITSDYSSTLVHEYFHVCDGFVKDKRDAEWMVEGLAEFFSARLLYDAKLITREQYESGIQQFKDQGTWGTNLTKTKKQKVFYKNAPVVLFVLDEMIRDKTGGNKSLKSVMPYLAKEERAINTALFQQKLEEVYGDSLKTFFADYVYGGKIPAYQKYFRKTGAKAIQKRIGG